MTDSTRFRLGLVILMAWVLTACGPQSPEKLIDDARISLGKGEVSAAVTNLKIALGQKPSSAEARRLLGRALLESGDAAAAIVELRKSQDLLPDPVTLSPLLAKAMLGNRQFQKLIDEFAGVELTEPSAQAELLGQVANAHLALGNVNKATEVAELAVKSNPTSAPALSVLAHTAAQAGKVQDAMAHLDKGIAAHPKDAALLSQLGTLQLRGLGDAVAAIATFRKVVALEPRHIDAHSNLLVLLLGQRDLPGAKAQLEFFTKNLPKEPQTLLFTAIVAHADKDSKRALESIQVALRTAPDNPQVLLFAGIIHLENRMLLNAERNLTQALTVNPNLSMARQSLAETYLRLGNADKALATLEPLIGNKSSGGVRTYALAGDAYVLAGDVDRSVGSFVSALKLDPDNATLATQLTLAKAKTVPLDKTVAELQKISAGDKGTSADLALVSVLMRAKDYTRATAAIGTLEKKLPKSPMASNLRGFVFVQQGDNAKARSSFEEALKLQPNYFAAVKALAALDVVAKRPDAAKTRYEEFLKADPKSGAANLELAKLLMNEPARKDEAVKYLKRAIAADPTIPAPHVMLIGYLLRSKDPKAALLAAQDARSNLADNPEIMDVVGRAQVAAGEVQQAVSTFAKLVTLEPNSPYAHVRLAGAHLAANNKSAGEQSLRKALAIAPDFVPAQQALISLAQEGGQHAEALQMARTVIRQRPKEPIGYVMAGAVETNRRNFAAAAAIYREGIKSIPDSRLAVSLHTALLSAAANNEADDFAKTWTTQHPKDSTFLAYLGDSALAREKFAAAEQSFRMILGFEPQNVTVLNNLAWAISRQNKKGGLAFAEKAVKLRPDNAGLLDTLAAVHAAEGNLAQAIEVQKKAMALSPNDQGLRFHLAQFYISKGNNAEAKTELQALEKFGEKLPVHAEVQRLLKTLQ